MRNPVIISCRRHNVVSVMVAFAMVWAICSCIQATPAKARKQLEPAGPNAPNLQNKLTFDVARTPSAPAGSSADQAQAKSREGSESAGRGSERELISYHVDYAEARTHPPTEP
ncbi:hypothetical protein L7F22_069329 [Adiantum nelumboides]|nr:hypothetical protein [Adiantum nelumboides]